MALVSESFKRSSALETAAPVSVSHTPHTVSEGLESTGFTSQDATISDIRRQTLVERAYGEPRSKRPER